MSFKCPSCQARVAPGQSTCPVCAFSLEVVDRQLGIPPQLMGPISDPHQTLSSSAVRRLTSKVNRLEKKFPQLRIAITLQKPPTSVTLPVFTFWLFNRGGLSSSVDRGAENFLILLVIDTTHPQSLRASTMVGYGLEPFITTEALTACLEAATTTRPEIFAENYLHALEEKILIACTEPDPGP